jgi:hypothetical protein
MTVGVVTGLAWHWYAMGVSAVGSYFACRRWSSRFAFFLLAPILYFLLWIPITAFVGIFPIPAAWAYLIGAAITLGLYVLNCVILYNDGVVGVSLLEGLGGTGPGGRETSGGGDGGTTPPPPITYRRLSLK